MASNNVSATYSYLQTTGNRFTGLASGMDIDSIVEKLMKAESAKMEKLQQQKQKYEWQRDAYRGINSKLEAFQTEIFDNYQLKTNTFLAKTASVSDTSKLSVKASSSASGTLTISDATLAENGQDVKRVVISPATGTSDAVYATNQTKLSELGLSDGTLKLNVVQKDGSTKELSVDYTSEDTLESLASKINKENKGLTAVVGEDGSFSLSTAATGEYDNGLVSIVSDDNSLMKSLGFASSNSAGTAILNGTDATYTINGVTKTSHTNTISELGYSITLNQAFSGSSVTISSTTDTDTIVENVKSFVELYNGLIDSLNSPIKEKKNYDYQPLTEAQKAEMSKEEIEKWEEKAKQGILRNDSIISNTVSSMRSAIYSVTTDLDGKYNAFYNIGITTTDVYSDGGKLKIDEDKLREAIEANPEAVADLFTRAEEKDADGNVVDKGGLITQLRATAKTTINLIEEKAGKEGAEENSFALGETIISVDDRIENWKDRLKDIEERYFKQFSAMEAAIQKANSQASLFAQG
ncbi:flagellar filament capping protein FliD [Lysinibacillus telephonicus]|uniref:flagellar filament capping protein FliD n=1 Tax=Lysinibacillus telephonicus TaxID=1714840 RepID=UPI0031FCE538